MNIGEQHSSWRLVSEEVFLRMLRVGNFRRTAYGDAIEYRDMYDRLIGHETNDGCYFVPPEVVTGASPDNGDER
jgi:hypothetical protein